MRTPHTIVSAPGAWRVARRLLWGALGLLAAVRVSATTYYVNDIDTANDVWCTAPGSSANSGTSLNQPKLSLSNLLATVSLNSNDVVYVDTGIYFLSNNIVITNGGGANSRVVLRGVSGATRLERGNRSNGTACIEVRASFVSVEGFTCANAEVGIFVDAATCRDAILASNTCYSNAGPGIKVGAASGTNGVFKLLQNLVYANGGGLALQGDVCTGDRFYVTNNTVTVTNSAAIAIGGQTADSSLRNNILDASWAGVCLTIYAASTNVLPLADFNDYYAHDGGRVAQLTIPGLCTNKSLSSLADWQNATIGRGGLDAHSFNQYPQFANPSSDYHLRSKSGRWLPTGGTNGIWLIDGTHSPCIDVGDPGSPYSAEPTNNGGRVNLGAYGNTAQASKSASDRILLAMAPDFGQFVGQTQSVFWIASGQAWNMSNDRVRLDYSLDGSNVWSNIAVSLLVNTGYFGWSRPTNTFNRPFGCTVRVAFENDLAINSIATLPTKSKEAGSYYVNNNATTGDLWCTQPGSDAADGLSPATPVASLQTILDRYTLGPGDSVYVDAGTYALTDNVIVAARHAGLSSQPIKLQGANRATVLDRQSRVAGAYAMDVQAPYVVVDGFSLVGADMGLHVTATNNVSINLSGNTCRGNARYGIRIDAAASTSGSVDVRHNVLFDNGAGVMMTGNGQSHHCNLYVKNNTIVVNKGSAVSMADSMYGFSAGNNIFDVSGSGIAVDIDRFNVVSTDYNDYFVHDGGVVGRVAVAGSAGYANYQVYSTLANWQVRDTAGIRDEHSLSRNPLFANPANGDFHECSRGGRWLLQSTGGGTWVIDNQHSSCIDAGNPNQEDYSAEPQPNGGRLNMGAYGNTLEASKSASTRLLQLIGLVSNTSPLQVSLAWNTIGTGWGANDSVRLEYSADGGMHWTVVPAASAIFCGTQSFTWDVGNLNFADATRQLRVRVVCNQDSSVKDEIVLGVQAPTSARNYYVNDSVLDGDVYCTAAGSLVSDGLTPASPKDSLTHLLESCALAPGDTVYVDTGLYAPTGSAVVTTSSYGTPDRFVRITGSPNGSVFDLSASAPDAAALVLHGDYVRVERLICRGGKSGIAVNASSCRHAILAANICYSNSAAGIEIKPWGNGGGSEYQVMQNVCWRNGNGLVLQGQIDNTANHAVFVVENNTLADNYNAAILSRNAGVSGWRTVNLKNNILRADGTNRVCLASFQNGITYSDFNNFDTTNSAVAAVWLDGADATTRTFNAFADWRDANGLDNNSFGTNSCFAGYWSGDYRLGPASPCVDAGVNSFWMLNARDADGEARVFGASVDMGAYESSRHANVRIFLQGPYLVANYRMNSGFAASGLLPPVSPYAADPRKASGVVSGAVDWVLVQLRETPDGAPVASRSAILRTDGWLVTDSGSTNLPMNPPAGTNFYISVKHRNHLAALAAIPMTFTNSTFAYDFTGSSSRYRNGSQTAVQVGPSAGGGIWASAAGDVDGDGVISPVDLAIAQSQANLFGYHRGDLTMDGWVDAASDQSLISNNMGRTAGMAKPETMLLPMMRLQPTQTALVPGATNIFTAAPTLNSNQFVNFANSSAGTSLDIRWAFVTNASSGQLQSLGTSNALYTAGTGTGRVDIVEAWNPVSDALGRVAASVLGTQEVAKAGQVILVAGRKSAGDSLWPVTDYLTDLAYTTLRYRGFAKGDIHYFNPETDQDVDGNGALDDIQGSSTLSNVAIAITNAGAADRLFIYLADHGGDSSGNGFFRLSADETLSAAQLRTWLDNLQNAHTQAEVTVLLDFCYAGSFLDELAYTGTARRIVIAACASNQPTYFVAGGLVSFSQAFFSGVLLGYDVKQSFDLAHGAMAAYQDGQLDDDKSGLYVSGTDGTASTGYYIGPTGVAASDAPVIGEVCGNQVLTEETSATLWVADVTSLQPVARVWCQIVPPGFAPNPTNPVTSLPAFNLTYDEDTGHYSVTYDAFTAPGTYLVLFYASDVNGRVSTPRQSYVAQIGYDDRLIFVAGGPTNATHWPAVQYLTSLATTVFRLRLFDSAHVRRLAPLVSWDMDLDGSNDVSALPSCAALQSAITGWARTNNTDRLTVYLVGSGETNTLRLNETETLNGATLAGWLDALQATNPIPVCVILDFAGAGAFVPALATTNPATGEPYERIVIASTQSDRDALFDGGGTVSFSQYFLSCILAGETAGDAFTTARRTIRRVSGGVRQRACLDDNGDGVSNEKNVDGAVAETTYIGSAFLTGDDTPVIGAVTPQTVLPDGVSTVLLWAVDISGIQGISNVWCTITPPDYAGTGALPATNLAWNAGASRYEALVGGFSLPGTYILTFYAIDNDGVLSTPVQSEILRVDAFETDDTIDAASLCYGPAQQHTFHTATDVDWARFYLTSNLVYDISTTHYSTNLDTVIDLYRVKVDGTLEAIDHVDEEGTDEGEYTGLDFPEEGFYYARISSYAANGTNGYVGSYEFCIDVPSAGSTYTLIVLGINTITAGALPTNSLAGVTGQTSKYFNGSTSVSFTGLTNGTYTVSVPTPTNYFFPRESPSAPGQVGSLTNLSYANPRQIQISGSWYMSGFEMIPYLTVGTGVVRDAWTYAFVDQAALAFHATSGSITGYTAQAHVIFTSYGTNWYSQPNGLFPANVILSENNWNLRVSHAGYATNVVTNAVFGASRGSVLNMGTIYLVPLDADADGLPDTWEQTYFPGVGASPTNDADGDGLSNLAEYLAGTNPTNALDGLSVTNILVSAGGTVALAWNVSPGRGYRVDATTNLSGSYWSPTGGVWTAAYGSSSMCWTSSPTAGPCFYRVAITNGF
ncbi:MAG: choice-of-anchor Q domain-containing protein [Kiritimatiellia bacterium]